MKEVLQTNTTWAEPTQYMINRGAKLSLYNKEVIIEDNDHLIIRLFHKHFWVMNDDSKEELPSGGSCIDIPHELRQEFIDVIKNLPE